MAYRTHDAQLWADEKFLELSDQGKLLWLFLLGGPQHTGLPGVYHIGRAAMAEHLDWDVRKLDQHLQEIQDVGLEVVVNWKRRVVMLPKAIKHSPPANQKVVRSWANKLEVIPKCEERSAWIGLLYEHLVTRDRAQWFRPMERFDDPRNTVSDTVPHTVSGTVSGTGSQGGNGSPETGRSEQIDAENGTDDAESDPTDSDSRKSPNDNDIGPPKNGTDTVSDTVSGTVCDSQTQTQTQTRSQTQTQIRTQTRTQTQSRRRAGTRDGGGDDPPPSPCDCPLCGRVFDALSSQSSTRDWPREFAGFAAHALCRNDEPSVAWLVRFIAAFGKHKRERPPRPEHLLADAARARAGMLRARVAEHGHSDTTDAGQVYRTHDPDEPRAAAWIERDAARWGRGAKAWSDLQRYTPAERAKLEERAPGLVANLAEFAEWHAPAPAEPEEPDPEGQERVAGAVSAAVVELESRRDHNGAPRAPQDTPKHEIDDQRARLRDFAASWQTRQEASGA